jgi:hypothetical protein
MRREQTEMAEQKRQEEMETGSLIMVTYLDHCSDDSDRTLEEIKKQPLTPPKCTSVGFKTYEDEDFIMIASEYTNHGKDSGDNITYANHTSILKKTILEIKPLYKP